LAFGGGRRHQLADSGTASNRDFIIRSSHGIALLEAARQERTEAKVVFAVEAQAVLEIL